MNEPRLERFLLGLQRLLLRLAPRAYRERFGVELLACAREAMRDARRARGSAAGLRRGLSHTLDVVLTALRLRWRQAPLLVPALMLSFAIGWIDARQDEVQPAALLLLVGTATLCFFDRSRARLWWLVLGLSVPGTRLWAELFGAGAPGPFLATFLALAPAGVGVCAGLLTRRIVTRSPRPRAHGGGPDEV